MTLEHVDTIIAFVAILTGVSLLVTILTQMTSALLSLRGANLRWGIATLLEHADPDLAQHAKTIANEVLTHTMISDSIFSDSDANIVQKWQLASAIDKKELINILHSLAAQAETAAPGQKPPAWAVALRNSLDNLDQTAADKLLASSAAIRAAIPPDVGNADDVIAQLSRSAEQLTGTINQWFDAMMDRVSQRFTMNARIVSVVFAVLIAFVLHLDAFQLFNRLSSDSELRARLISSSDALVQEAGPVLSTPPGAPALEDAAAMRQLTNSVAEFNSILNDKLKFQIVPDPYPTKISDYWTPSWTHFWGIVVSAALLSMGAPFWYNLLKDLLNLRSTVAQKQDDASPNPPKPAK